jgi:hypothetical protein
MAVRERDLSATIKFIHQGLTPHAMINFKKQRVFGKIFFVQNFVGSNPTSPSFYMGEWPNWKRQLPAKQSILNRQTIVDVKEYDIKNLRRYTIMMLH